MNKFLTTLFAGAVALSLGSAAFAADVAKPVETAKTEAAMAVAPAKAHVAKTNHQNKHAKKVAAVAPAAK